MLDSYNFIDVFITFFTVFMITATNKYFVSGCVPVDYESELLFEDKLVENEESNLIYQKSKNKLNTQSDIPKDNCISNKVMELEKKKIMNILIKILILRNQYLLKILSQKNSCFILLLSFLL